MGRVTARPTIVILGPTASGKSALAMALADLLPGGALCIGADSMQVYRGMDIGTAKPSLEDRARVPHALVDIAEPAEAGFTVERWLALAREAEECARRGGLWPILVGGTNLYVKAFIDGLFEGPPPDPALRSRLEALAPDDLRRALESHDPAAATRIHRNDRRRTIRALEVYLATGRPISSHQQQWGAGDPSRFDRLRLVGLEFSVEAINRRINARVREMMAQGLLEEVRALHDAGRLGPQAREAVGYKQLIEHLEGGLRLDDAVESVKIASRRLGKQQRTWLRRFRGLPNARWFDGESADLPALARRAAGWLLESAEAIGSDAC
jgi:tRNA dimethylallyltransferase